jgi:hypothetical protein
MAAVPSFIRCGCHLVLALSYVRHSLHASTSPASRTDWLLSLANGVAKPAGIRDKFYDFHDDICIHQSVLQQAHYKHDIRANPFKGGLRIQYPSRHMHLFAWTVSHRADTFLHTAKENKLPVNWWVCTHGMGESTFPPLEGSLTRTVVKKRLRFWPCFCDIYRLKKKPMSRNFKLGTFYGTLCTYPTYLTA